MNKLGPVFLDQFSIQLKNALKVAENVPQYVLDDCERFRKSINRWSEELKAEERKVANG